MEILKHIEASSINRVINTDWQHVYLGKEQLNWQEMKLIKLGNIKGGQVPEKQSHKIGWNDQPLGYLSSPIPRRDGQYFSSSLTSDPEGPTPREKFSSCSQLSFDTNWYQVRSFFEVCSHDTTSSTQDHGFIQKKDYQWLQLSTPFGSPVTG